MAYKKAHVLYSGRVQGVGFRYTAENIASKHKIRGWVKNLPDGRVELAAEAEEEKVIVFLQELESLMQRHIREKQFSWEEPTKNTEDFEIRF